MTLKNIVKNLNKTGHNITYRVRTDGGIVVTSVDGIKTKIVEGNRIVRNLANTPISQKRFTQTQRNITEKIIKPTIDKKITNTLHYAQRLLKESNVKMHLTTKRLREHINLVGEEEAFNHITRIKRYLQGYAYEENVDNLKDIIEHDFRKSKLRDKIIDRIENNKENFKERDLQEILELQYNRNKTMTRHQILEAISNFLDEKKYKE